MAGDIAHRDQNFVPTLLVASNAGDGALVELWGDPTTHRLLVDASVTVSGVTGTKSNNAVVPGATNLGVLPAIATAAAPSYTEGYQVGLSTDLAGALRVTGSLSVGGTTDNSAFTAGTSTGTPAMGFYHSTIDVVTDGRAAALAIDSKRNLFTVIRDAAGNARGINVDANGEIGVTVRSGAIASGAVAAGAFAAGSIPAGAISAGALSFVKLEDAASASGDAGVPAMAIQLATPADTAADGDYVMLQMSAGRLWVSAKVDTALPAGTNAIGKLASNTGVTIGAVEIAAAQTLATVTTVTTVSTLSNTTQLTPGTAAANLGKAEDAVHTSGDVGVFALAVANQAQSSFAADGDYTPIAVDVKGNSLTVGNVAHDAADAGYPLKVGGRARSSEITAVASDDRVDAIYDLVGKQIVLPYANPENFVSGVISSAMTGTTSTSLIAAPAAGLRNYITQITVSNTHATVGTNIEIQDGNGGTTIYIIPAAAVYGGATITFPTPLRQPTTATAIYCKNTTTGASTFVSASGYKGA